GRLDGVRARLQSRMSRAAAGSATVGEGAGRDLAFESSLSRARYLAGVDAVRERIAQGAIYQANLTRRLATPFDADPWPLYRRLRTGDPSLFSAYVDLGRGAPGHGSESGAAPARPRAILSASPEPFLAVSRHG